MQGQLLENPPAFPPKNFLQLKPRAGNCSRERLSTVTVKQMGIADECLRIAVHINSYDMDKPMPITLFWPQETVQVLRSYF